MGRARGRDGRGRLPDARDRPGRPLFQGRRRKRLATLEPSLGAWRSLVARTVRVGEVPGSNPGAPIELPRLEAAPTRRGGGAQSPAAVFPALDSMVVQRTAWLSN